MRILLLMMAALVASGPGALRAADAAPPAGAGVKVLYRQGDDARWAEPGWDDREWQTTDPDLLYLPTHDGIYWVRVHLRRGEERADRPVARTFFWPRDEPGSPINSAFMAAPFSFELFWDGKPIRRSGVVGVDRAAEVPGPLDNLIPLPEELLGPGEHVLAVRLSTWHYNFNSSRSGFYFALENYTDRLLYESRLPLLPLVGASGALLAAVFCAVLFFFVERRRPLWLCSALSLVISVFYFLIAWRWLHNDSYDWFAPRLMAISAAMTLICGLQGWLVLEQFGIPRKRWWLAPLAPLIIAAWISSPLHAVVVHWLFRTMLVFTLAAAGWALGKRRTGAAWAVAGALLGLGSAELNWDARGFVSPAFLLTFGVQLLFLFVALGLQMREDRHRAQQAVLTAARLEIELLKKNIQPHFLMNTLTTIMEVIEQEPKSAVTLIEALAGEFRILARVSGEKLIPLAQELELCRAHLRIMGLRQGVACTLTTTGVDERQPVPPALFHTLVEGGLTHQIPRQGALNFTLAGEHLPGLVRYRFVAHGDNPPQDTPPREGTGLRYVKARLEESFAGRWSLAAEAVSEGWRTVIEIRHAAGKEPA